MGKYDIIDKHYHEARDVISDLIGAELHEKCERFPPAVLDFEWDNEAFERRFKGQLKDLPKPDSIMVAMLARVLDLEFDHEIEEVDMIMKHGGLKLCCPTPAHEQTFMFLWQDLLHHVENRACELKGGLRRKDKHAIVDSLRKRAMIIQDITAEELSKLH